MQRKIPPRCTENPACAEEVLKLDLLKIGGNRVSY